MPRLRSAITRQDIDTLREAHHILIRLLSGLHPGSGWYPPLFAAVATLRGCAAEWSGDPGIWPTANVRVRDPSETSPLVPPSPYLRGLAQDYGHDFDDAATIRKVIAELERSMAVNDDPDEARDALRELRERLQLIYRSRRGA